MPGLRRLPLIIVALLVVASRSSAQEPDVAISISRIEGPQSPYRQGLDGFSIEQLMAKYHVPGMSVAVIKDFHVAWAKAYGIADAESRVTVTPHTLFQACSISKPLTAMSAVLLAQEGKLDLDQDVNRYLKSWQVDRPSLKDAPPVTPRSLFSHTSGSDDGYGLPGYDPGAPLPTLVQVLNGEKPSNVGPVLFARPPYSASKYSGGGLVIMQVALTDLTQRPFAEFMQQTVLGPLGMMDSTYQQPLPAEKAAQAASAHDRAGKRNLVPWHVYPEQGAAGLWTTPTDLSQFVIEVQRASQGLGGKVLSRTGAKEMVTPVGVGPFAVGLEMRYRGEGWYFSHSGSNWGFLCNMVGHLRKGYGLVIMTNSDSAGPVIAEVEARIAAAYAWDTLDKPMTR